MFTYGRAMVAVRISLGENGALVELRLLSGEAIFHHVRTLGSSYLPVGRRQAMICKRYPVTED